MENQFKIIREQNAEIDALKKQIAKLKQALKPFADEADQWAPRHPGQTEPRHPTEYPKAVFSIGHLRRAKRLMAK